MRTLSLASFLFILAFAVNVHAQCDPALVVPDDGTGIATPVVISQIDPGSFIEFFNPGNTNFNLTGWWLCSPFTYSPLSITVNAGSYKTVSWPAGFGDTDASGEIMLYKSSSFATNTDIVDYVCWGASNQFRYGQAIAVGKWVGACAPALTNGSIHRISNTTGTGASSYDVTLASNPRNCTSPVTGIEDTPAYPAIKLSIGPNPFSAVATIEFTLSTAAAVNMSVYSVKGERVRHFETTNYRQGGGRMLWDGRDDAGRTLPSGTYLVRVSANNSTVTQRVTILH
jgi:hypothetical protein